MKSKRILLFFIFVLVAGVFLFFAIPVKKKISGSKIKVVTTLFPFYDLAKSIGGTNVEVNMLIPPGIEPHSFEPKPADVIFIHESDMFFYTSMVMEPWLTDIIDGIQKSDITVLEANSVVNATSNTDPHIWLDVDNFIKICDLFLNALKLKNPENATYYDKNYNDYVTSLKNLDERFKNELKNCKTRKIIYGGHYAFAYMAKRYNLDYVSALGMSPDAEPTASNLATLINQVKSEGINYVFYEELTNPQIAVTLANETKTKLLFLNAGHNITKQDILDDVSYFDILKYDLDNLKTGMECK